MAVTECQTDALKIWKWQAQGSQSPDYKAKVESQAFPSLYFPVVLSKPDERAED